MTAGLGFGLIVRVDLIHPLLEQRTKDIAPGLQEQLTEGCFHLKQGLWKIL